MFIKHSHLKCEQPEDWKQNLALGDIVTFRFPISFAELAGSSEAPPCLVCDVTIIADFRLITLICGTPGEKAQGPYQMLVSCPAAISATGLALPTLFDGNIRITVSAGHNGFVLGDDRTPIIGRLFGAERRSLEDIRSRIQDGINASQRRSERRRNHTAATPTSISPPSK